MSYKQRCILQVKHTFYLGINNYYNVLTLTELAPGNEAVKFK